MVFNAHFLGLTLIQASLAVAYAKKAAIAAAQTPPSTADNIIWYNNASGTEWITQGLPIGNGFQAATVSGRSNYIGSVELLDDQNDYRFSVELKAMVMNLT